MLGSDIEKVSSEDRDTSYLSTETRRRLVTIFHRVFGFISVILATMASSLYGVFFLPITGHSLDEWVWGGSDIYLGVYMYMAVLYDTW